MRVGFVAINSGGTMGHMSIVARAAKRLWQQSKTECVIMSDSTFDIGSTTEDGVICIQLPTRKHQFSMAGCISETPTSAILEAVELWECKTVVFSTFFSVDCVSSLAEAGTETILLTFPLRDSHWETFIVRGYQHLFRRVLVFSDLYETCRLATNQICVSPFSNVSQLKRGKKPCMKNVLVLVGGGGRPSANLLHKLAIDTMGLLRAQSIDLDWSLSVGTHTEQTKTEEFWLTWRPDIGTWISDYDIIISEAGFNTTTELLCLGVPAILVPGHRRIDNQELRAINYERYGCGICSFPEEGPRGLANAIYSFLDGSSALSAASHRSIAVARGLANSPSFEEVIFDGPVTPDL